MANPTHHPQCDVPRGRRSQVRSTLPSCTGSDATAAKFETSLSGGHQPHDLRAVERSMPTAGHGLCSAKRPRAWPFPARTATCSTKVKGPTRRALAEKGRGLAALRLERRASERAGCDADERARRQAAGHPGMARFARTSPRTEHAEPLALGARPKPPIGYSDSNLRDYLFGQSRGRVDTHGGGGLP